MEIHNVDQSERFRITISMSQTGKWAFSVIGMHTPHEVIGLLTSVSMLMAKELMDQKSPDLVRELTGIKR